jgi:hypothetical protein
MHSWLMIRKKLVQTCGIGHVFLNAKRLMRLYLAFMSSCHLDGV